MARKRGFFATMFNSMQTNKVKPNHTAYREARKADKDSTKTYIPNDTSAVEKRYGLTGSYQLNAEGMESLGAFSHLQHVISKIQPDWITVRVIPAEKAPIPPGWAYVNDEFAVIWRNRAVAFDYGRKLWRLGLLDGKPHNARVCRPPEFGTYYSIQVPYRSWRDACACCSVPPTRDSSFCIGSYPADRDPIVLNQFYIPHSQWLGKDFTGDTELSVCLVPPPKGSKAKPHIRVFRHGELLAEVDARQGCYKHLVEMLKRGITDCHVSSKVHADGHRSHRVEYQLESNGSQNEEV